MAKDIERMKEIKIKAIIFDVGGVLQLPKNFVRLIQDPHLAGVPMHCGHRNKNVHEYLSNKLKIFLDQWFYAIDAVYSKSIEGKLSQGQVLEVISKNLGVNKIRLKHLLIHAYKKNFSLNKELLEKIKKLKKKGYRVSILSDQWHFSKLALVPKKLSKYFFPVIVSFNVGFRKPHPKIYKLMLKKLKLRPGQCLFIDNQEWNLRPAKKLKMHTILFKNNKQLFKEKQWRELFKQFI